MNHPSQTTVYVAAEKGMVTKVRNNKWRVFDFLWMLHTMDYQGRDNFGNLLLRVFSIAGIVTILSGLALYLVSGGSKKKPVIQGEPLQTRRSKQFLTDPKAFFQSPGPTAGTFLLREITVSNLYLAFGKSSVKSQIAILIQISIHPLNQSSNEKNLCTRCSGTATLQPVGHSAGRPFLLSSQGGNL